MDFKLFVSKNRFSNAFHLYLFKEPSWVLPSIICILLIIYLPNFVLVAVEWPFSQKIEIKIRKIDPYFLKDFYQATKSKTTIFLQINSISFIKKVKDNIVNKYANNDNS